uniref:Uncharacterized protein n=1 Tax=Octopus bimaculoides TaxID=37653 RepID=A0A0L8H5Q1_OCTBM
MDTHSRTPKISCSWRACKSYGLRPFPSDLVKKIRSWSTVILFSTMLRCELDQLGKGGKILELSLFSYLPLFSRLKFCSH